MSKVVSISILAALLAGTAYAEEAPAPHRMPRIPVSRELLGGTREAMPASREKHGLASVIDGEKLRIGETSLRLFGIVPPQLSASFGPQARAELDALAAGQSVSCQIRDRDRDGWLLATCANASGHDMALELLKRGLAVAARGSIADTELATTYPAAEQAAQSQKIGLWSSVAPASAPASAAAVVLPPKPEPAPVVEAKKEEKARSDEQTQAKIVADVLAQQTRLDEMDVSPSLERGFFERYQILISGLLMFATATGIMGALSMQKRRERRDELKGLAAALRGELMAARNICAGRARSITSDAEDRIASWPRVRATLYQAYVGRLGFLGADLARQVASIYGQSSDYAAFYTPSSAPISGSTHDVPKKQALETLIKRIDEVLPKLGHIERTGALSRGFYAHPTPRTPVETVPTAAMREATPDGVTYAPAAQTEVDYRSAMTLWEGAIDFLRGCRDALTPSPPLPPSVVDPQVAEYAALIEADMARYQYEDQSKLDDIFPQRKKG